MSSGPTSAGPVKTPSVNRLLRSIFLSLHPIQPAKIRRHTRNNKSFGLRQNLSPVDWVVHFSTAGCGGFCILFQFNLKFIIRESL
jgi:hypothetical protein